MANIVSYAVTVLKNRENKRVQIIIKNSHKQNITWQTTPTITDKGFKQKVTAQDPQKANTLLEFGKIPHPVQLLIPYSFPLLQMFVTTCIVCFCFTGLPCLRQTFAHLPESATIPSQS